VYGQAFRTRVECMGIEEVLTAPRSPWQNPFAERVIGSVRRECLDHVIVLGEQHLRRRLGDYFEHYHRWRCHRSLAMDCPEPRTVATGSTPRPGPPRRAKVRLQRRSHWAPRIRRRRHPLLCLHPELRSERLSEGSTGCSGRTTELPSDRLTVRIHPGSQPSRERPKRDAPRRHAPPFDTSGGRGRSRSHPRRPAGTPRGRRRPGSTRSPN
jgi:hypothetical protein